MYLSPATGSLDPSGKAVKASGLELVCMQLRKQRLALWAASRVPDPSFTAMVFEPCDRVCGPERKGSQSHGLELVSRQFRKQRLVRLELVSRQFRKQRLTYGLPAAGPIRPSLPWCLSPATRSLDPSGRAAKVKVWS